MDWNSLMTPIFWIELLTASIGLATPLVLAALGEVFAERSGILNLGLEGIMLFSGFVGFTAAFYTENLWAGVLLALAVGAVMGLIFAFFTITLRANQTVIGLSIMFLGQGLAQYLYRLVFKVSLETPRVTPFENIAIPVLSDIPVIGPIIFNHSIFTYLMFVLVIVSMIVIYKTPFGLRMNAVGESPETADTMGVNVIKMRYVCVVAGSALAGMAGAFYSLVELGSYSDSMINGRGFIASALVIFGRWNPLWTLGGGVLFGCIDAFQNRLQVMGSPIPSNFLQMTPYIITIVVLLIGKRCKPPAALCIPYIRK